MKPIKVQISVLLFISFIAMSCNSIKTTIYDQYSYQETISLKVESDNLMNKATESYNLHDEVINQLLLDLQKLLEYEKNKPNNEISYAMLKLIANEDKNLLAGFFKRWKDQDQLSAVFTSEAKGQIMEAFDLIIKYESKKNKTSESNILDFLSNN